MQDKNKTLADCVLESFSDIRPKYLKDWCVDFKKSTSVDPEPLLFIALVCEAQFRISHPQVQDSLNELREWLTDEVHPRMNPDLAEVVIEALTPGMSRVLASRGFKIGDAYVHKKGRPPETRGAWIAVLIAGEYLKGAGIKASLAKEQVRKFITVLLSREDEVDDQEFHRMSKKNPKKAIKELARQLSHQYEILLKQDGIRAGDLSPSKDAVDAYAKWRVKHIGLSNVIRDLGVDGICSGVKTRVGGVVGFFVKGKKL